MSRTIPDERLETLTLLASGYRKREGQARWMTIDSRELACIVDELRRRRQSAGRKGAFKYGKTTQLLMSMQVGDVISLPPTTQGALTTARATARKALGAPDARWHCEQQPDGTVRCERRPDGSDHIYGKPRNPAIAVLASMEVGQTVVIAGKMYNALRVQARKEMGLSTANWRSENLANGSVRVKRIA